MKELLRILLNKPFLVYLICFFIPLSIPATRIVAKLIFIVILLSLLSGLIRLKKEDLTILSFSIYQLIQATLLGVFRKFLSISFGIYSSFSYGVKFFKFSPKIALDIVLLASALLSTTFIFQSFTGINLKQLSSIDLSSLKFTFPPQRPWNPILEHPLTVGGVISTGAIIGIFRYIERKTPIYLAGIILNIFALLVSYDRSYWLSFFFSVLIALTFVFQKQSLKRKLAILCILCILPFSILSVPSFESRFKSIFDTTTNGSNIYRLAMWESGIKFFKEASFTEKLLGTSRVKFKEKIKPFLIKTYGEFNQSKEVKIKLEPIIFNHLHNNFINILVCYGILGLTVFILLFGFLLKVNFCSYRESGNLQYLMFLTIYINWLLAGLFEYNFGDEAVKFLMFLMIGINIKYKELNA